MNCGHSCAEVFRMFEGYYGPYFTPSVDADGNLTWTNNAGLPDPAPINIKGEPGTGLEISGLVATEADLPATAEDWTCYLVGTEVPYTVYTYNPNSGWISLGQLASGPKGDPGAVYTPSVSPEGVISWTNDGDLPNPEPVNIKGPKGDPGGGGGTSNYNDLVNQPQIGGVTLIGNKTPAQLGLVAAQQGAGLIPDTERQQIGENADDIAELQGEQQQQGSDLQQLQDDVDAIEEKIPNQASAQNQLADKEFVNSSINSAAAFFRGSFASRAALLAVAWQTSDPSAANFVSNNDYAYVQDDESQNDEAWRYIYVLETGGQNNGWQPQFRVNESPLTAAQVAALNSGATAALIAQITANQTAIAGKITAPNAPALDQYLKWNGTAWVAEALPVNPDAKTTDQTQPVGVDSSGKLWTAPGGGGGSSDYNDLENKPQIGGVTVQGNKSLSEFGIRNAPSGGSTDQVLAKASAADGDFKWMSVSGGSGGSSRTLLGEVAISGGITMNIVSIDYATGVITVDDCSALPSSAQAYTGAKVCLIRKKIGARLNTLPTELHRDVFGIEKITDTTLYLWTNSSRIASYTDATTIDLSAWAIQFHSSGSPALEIANLSLSNHMILEAYTPCACIGNGGISFSLRYGNNVSYLGYSQTNGVRSYYGKDVYAPVSFRTSPYTNGTLGSGAMHGCGLPCWITVDLKVHGGIIAVEFDGSRADVSAANNEIGYNRDINGLIIENNGLNKIRITPGQDFTSFPDGAYLKVWEVND